MTTSILRRTIVASALLAVGVLAMQGWGLQRSQPAKAATTTPTLAAAIDVNGGGDDCDTRFDTGSIGSTCTVNVGSMFTVKGQVISLAGLPNTGRYAGFNYLLRHTAGLTANDRSGTTEILWPDCLFGASSMPSGLTYPATCLTNTGALASLFTGTIVAMDYTCPAAGQQTITLDDAGSYLHDDTHAQFPDKEGDGVLTINCVSPSVGGIAKLSGVADAAPLAAEHSSSAFSIGLVAGLAAFATAIAVLGGAAWRQRRKRLG